MGIPLSTFCALPSDSDVTALEIHMVVRDDALLLFGFFTESEKALFEALLSVSGVGPKVALAMLSGLSPRDIARAVESADAARLKAIPGVGRKLAERIVLELKEKIGKLEISTGGESSGPMLAGESEAESALLHLGYGVAEARLALERVRTSVPEAMPIERLLREALRILSH